ILPITALIPPQCGKYPQFRCRAWFSDKIGQYRVGSILYLGFCYSVSRKEGWPRPLKRGQF
ncbi:MAG: hypothetical protein Q8P76_00780, partial [bacterium]|nr:hypothetical protein [bacterium]